MDDNQKSSSELLKELNELRRQVSELKAEANYKQAENDFFHSRKMLQLILNTIPARVFWKDKNSIYIGCNKPFAKDAGFDNPEDIVGKNDFDLGWKDNANLYRSDDKLVMESRAPKLNYVEPQIKPDGKQSWLKTSKIPLYDRNNNVIGILGTYEDFTECRLADEAFQHERILLKTLIENLPDAIYAKDKDGRKILANAADVHNIGKQSEAEVLGKNDYDLFPEEIARGFFEDDQKVIKTGEPVINREEFYINSHGDKKWF